MFLKILMVQFIQIIKKKDQMKKIDNNITI